MIKNYYRALGLSENAEDVVIRAAFKLLAHQYHPDKWTQENKEYANRKMAEINEAHRNLTSPFLKVKHDRQLSRAADYGADYYEVLGLLNNADELMIRTTYAALAQKYCNSPERLNRIKQAYKTLSNPAQRKAYDLKQKIPVFQDSGFSLWKIYLAYSVGFYIFLAGIVVLVIAAKTISH